MPPRVGSLKTQFSVQACQVDNRWTLTVYLLCQCSPQHMSKGKMATSKGKKLGVFLFFFSREHNHTNIISYYNTKHIRHFTMQVKNRIPTDPTAEQLNIKTNKVFKILMAVATFQGHCIELLNKKIQLICNRFLWKAPGQHD